LKEFRLDGNGLTTIPNDYLVGCTRLGILKVTNNALLYLPNLDPIKDTVFEINFSDNHLKDVIQLFMLEFPRLENLILDDNQLNHIELSGGE